MSEAIRNMLHPSDSTVRSNGTTPLLRDAHVYALLALVTAIIYAKSVIYQYTFVDDIYLVVVNRELLSSFANIPKLFTTDVFISMADPVVFYRPLMNLLFMLEVHLVSDSPMIFHVTNIILHIGCTLLVFEVLKQLRVSRELALAAALIFCAHPLNTSAVVWIPGRNDTLLTLFVLSSLWMFLRAVDTNRPRYLVGHLVFFSLALLTKETAFAIPVLTLTYAVFVRKERLFNRTNTVAIPGYVGLGIVWLLLRSMVTRTFEVHESLSTLILNWLHNSPAFLLYIGKVLLPVNLAVFPNLTDQSLLPGIIALSVLVVAYVLKRPTSNRQLLWGLGWFVLFLAPTLFSGNIFYEHRAYCALVGLFFAITQLPLVQQINFSKPAHVLGLVAVIAVFGVIAMIHSEHFRDRTAFAISAYQSSPSIDQSYSALGGLYLDEGDDVAAEQVLRKGIARNPAMRSLHRMLGDVYTKRHQFALAANEYETAIRLEPLQLYTYIDYGKMCLASGRFDDAARLWKESVAINPDFLLGYEYLTNFYLYTKHDPDSAMMYAKKIQEHGVAVLPELLRDIQQAQNQQKKK